jgi:hypothetical protein
MSLPQTPEIRDRVSGDPQKIRALSATIEPASRSDGSKIMSVPAPSTFLEDFTLEHSMFGSCISEIQVAGIF